MIDFIIGLVVGAVFAGALSSMVYSDSMKKNGIGKGFIFEKNIR